VFGTKKPGFTLLELVVALAIFAILATIIIPQLGRGDARKRREQFVLQLNALVRHAAIDALVTNKMHKIVIDVANRRITVQQQTTQKDDQGQWLYTTPRRPYAQKPLLIPRDYSINNLIIEGFDEMSRFTGGTTTTVWFYSMPQGLTQAVTINMLDKNDKRHAHAYKFRLVLNPLSAQFRIYDAWQ